MTDAERSQIPKYEIHGNALILHRGDEVVVAAREERTRSILLRHPDVRALTVDEAHELQQTLPANFEATYASLGSSASPAHAAVGGIRLGDLVSRVTSALRIKECGACRQRKNALNNLVWWPPSAWRRRPTSTTGRRPPAEG
ncbi:hypothetical protein [Amycolatopsis sp. NPDC003731]